MSKIGILDTVKSSNTRIYRTIAPFGRVLDTFPPKPSNTTYREMSGISINEYTSHFHISHKNKTIYWKSWYFTQMQVFKKFLIGYYNLFSNSLFMKIRVMSIMICKSWTYDWLQPLFRVFISYLCKKRGGDFENKEHFENALDFF